MKNTEAQKRAVKKYRAEKVKRFSIEFPPPQYDLFDHISKQPKKQTYIKNLIRADLDKQAEEQERNVANENY